MNNEIKIKKNRRGCYSAIAITLIIFGLTIGVAVYIINKHIAPNNNDKKLLSRPANITDISITMNDDISLSSIYNLKANKDISNLQITIHFYDSKENLIISKIKVIGNVQEGKSYTFKFEVTDFNLTELWNITYWNYDITGGTVSYFA